MFSRNSTRCRGIGCPCFKYRIGHSGIIYSAQYGSFPAFDHPHTSMARLDIRYIEIVVVEMLFQPFLKIIYIYILRANFKASYS